MPVSVPLGLIDAPRKFEEGNVLQGQADRAAERTRRAAAEAESHRKFEEIWARLDKMGSLPGMPKIPQSGEMSSGARVPTVAPSENDPARDMTPMGKSPQLTQRDIEGDPIPAQYRQEGVGGPEQEQPPQDELAAIEAELARRELAAVEAELARRGQGQSEPAGSIDDAINESVKQIPGGYKSWLEKTQPAPEGQRYELDPLSKSGKYSLVPDDPAAREKATQDRAWGGDIQDTPDGPWNEQLADILSGGVEGIMDVFKGQKDTANDPVGTAAETFVKPMLDLPASALRDPGGTALAISPFHQAARAYGAANSALIDATEGDLEGAKNNAGTALMEGANATLGFAGAGLVKPKGPRSALDAASAATKQPPVREPSVRQAGKTLAATAVPNRPIRPQAMRAIEKILINGSVPRDRIASGLTEVVNLLQGSVDGGGQSARPLTVGAALKKVFGDEFPEVRQNIDTVRLERRLTRKRGDSSPATVRETVQDMRGSQVPFLTESATKNMGATTRNATRKDMEAQLREFGEEGYTPIISQPIDAARTQRIQEVLTGPGMAELGKPLRQIAAGEGKTIEQMMQESPIAAAHWMQHKARLLAEENGGTTLGNAYTSMRKRILATIDDLKTPEGQTYKDLRAQYAETAKIGTDLKAGDQFGAIVRNPEKATAFVEKFEAATPAQQEAQLASIGDWVLSKLRGGGEEAAARMTDIQNIAVLETLDRLGAKGKALADDIRAIRDEELDLSRFYPKSESQTVTNSVALKEGPDIYSKQGGAGASASALADAGLMTAGASNLPILSMVNKGVEGLRELRRPRRATREDMTKVLMSRPGKGARSSALVEPPTTPKPPKTEAPPKGTVAFPSRNKSGLQDLVDRLVDANKRSKGTAADISAVDAEFGAEISKLSDIDRRFVLSQVDGALRRFDGDPMNAEIKPFPKTEAPSKGGAVETVDLYAGSEGGYADFSNYPLDKAGGAIFTTKSPQLASQYGTPRKVQVTGRILDGDTPEAGQLAREFWSERGAPEGISLREWPNAIYNEPAVNAEFREFLTSKGYAAYIKPPKRQGEGKHSYVVLDPKAIKYTDAKPEQNGFLPSKQPLDMSEAGRMQRARERLADVENPEGVEQVLADIETLPVATLTEFAKEYTGITRFSSRKQAVDSILQSYTANHQIAAHARHLDILEDFGGGQRASDFARVIYQLRKGDKASLAELRGFYGLKKEEIIKVATRVTGKPYTNATDAMRALESFSPRSKNDGSVSALTGLGGIGLLTAAASLSKDDKEKPRR